MVDDDNLSSVLSEFARTMLTDFRIQNMLDHLVVRIVDVLSITGAGVTLISPGRSPQYVAASDDAALRFERLQTTLGQGPCLTAYESGAAVSVPDLADDGRFPEFGPAAVAAGMAAVFTFPLRRGDGQLGALDLYRDTVGPLSVSDLAAAQTLADVAAAYLLNAQAREELLSSAERFRHSALHDALTGLPNRALFQQRLEHAAQRARRSHSLAAVLFADLDRFKRVNDTHGHSGGDKLLVAVAHRLAALVRPGDTLARVSGDEFVFLCEDLTHALDVELLATRLHDAFRAPFQLGGTELFITASVGIAYAGPGEDITDELVTRADTAMYQAKRAGGAGHRVIDLRSAHAERARHDLEHDLRAAIQRADLDVAYQPIVRTEDGLVVGAEALLRWVDVERGPVPALTAVRAAEQSGLIADLGALVLERCCREWVGWNLRGDRPLDLCVNVSALQVMGPDLYDALAGVLASTGMDPTALVLEVTEGIFLEDGNRAVSVLADLKQLGVRLALDDFGTGYSSLSYLRRLPLDIVKIDRSFVADLGRRDSRATAIVAGITQLAQALGLTVTAEGVETARQHDELLGTGCELAQGYLYARPMTGADLSTRLRASPVSGLRLPTSAAP